VPDKRLPNGTIFGWFMKQNKDVLSGVLSDKTEVVLELGALVGRSTHWIAENAPNATIITIDHWRGSREHQKSEKLADVIHRLFVTFCKHMWEYRDRVIPMRTTTIAGMLELFQFVGSGFAPEVVYIDAGHETGPVYADTILPLMAWPDAHIVGDDGGWTSIQAALVDVRRMTDRTVCNHGVAWEIPPSGKPLGLPAELP
jgi:hypothetical protein